MIKNKIQEIERTRIFYMTNSSCDTCAYNVYDDEDECYYCEVNMDEDDMVRMMEGHYKSCPYYRNGDEYAVVRHQI